MFRSLFHRRHSVPQTSTPAQASQPVPAAKANPDFDEAMKVSRELVAKESAGTLTPAEAFRLVKVRGVSARLYPDIGSFESPQQTSKLAEQFRKENPRADMEYLAAMAKRLFPDV
jgi:hypothetical protein